MSVDLVIVNYNTQTLLKRLLDTLCSSNTDCFKLYIADNGSSDGSGDFLTDYRDLYKPEAIVLNDNIGYSRAVNHLASLGSGPYIGVLNADVWLDGKAVQAIKHSFEAHPEQAIMGPKQMDENHIIRFGGIFWGKGPHKLVHRGWNELDYSDVLYHDRVECATVSGSAYFVRRSVWDEMAHCPDFKRSCPEAEGAFLVTKHYFEETYLSMHAAHHGHKIFYDGTVPTIGHTWNASTPGENRGKLTNYMVESREIYKKACAEHGIRNEFT